MYMYVHVVDAVQDLSCFAHLIGSCAALTGLHSCYGLSQQHCLLHQLLLQQVIDLRQKAEGEQAPFSMPSTSLTPLVYGVKHMYSTCLKL